MHKSGDGLSIVHDESKRFKIKNKNSNPNSIRENNFNSKLFDQPRALKELRPCGGYKFVYRESYKKIVKTSPIEYFITNFCFWRTQNNKGKIIKLTEDIIEEYTDFVNILSTRINIMIILDKLFEETKIKSILYPAINVRSKEDAKFLKKFLNSKP